MSNNKRKITIGSKIFVVNKSYSKKKIPGGTVLSARIIGFQNVNNEIVPLFKVADSEYTRNSTSKNYDYFLDIDEAISAIATNK